MSAWAYETAALRGAGDIEFGRAVGGITMLDGADLVGSRSLASPPLHRKASALSDVAGYRYLMGIATNFGKCHHYKGRLEMFAPKCFDASIASGDKIGFLLDHTAELAVTFDVDSLELFSDKKSLIFRLKVPDSDLGRIAVKSVETGEREECSVGYIVERQEDLIVDDHEVRIIHQAILVEISAGVKAVVPGTCIMPTKDARSPLATLAGSMDCERAAFKFERALRNISGNIGHG